MGMKNIREIIANNLQTLRKQRKLTQAEVGESVHFSDKAVSRWEKGDSLPDVETLQKLAELFGVSAAYLFEEHIVSPMLQIESKKQLARKMACVFLSVLMVWLTALFVFLYLQIYNHTSYWQIFIWAITASALALRYFNKIWGNPKFNIAISSLLIWSFILSIYCQFIKYNLWLILFIGLPIQVIIILRRFIKNIKLSEMAGE